MSNIYLKFPTMEDKTNWISYIDEFKLINKYHLPLAYHDSSSYEEWLKKINDESNGINLEEGRVPSTAYFLMKDDEIIGNISIRHNLDSEFLTLYGGHIGYSIRPSERRKGYATMMLHLALKKCQELGLTDVMVTCKENNIGSAKTIENNFGVETDKIYMEQEQSYLKRYWINIKTSLEKFENKKSMIRK